MAAADVVELIKNDHREVERLFDLLKNQPATRGLNFPVLCALLIAHSRAEEVEKGVEKGAARGDITTGRPQPVRQPPGRRVSARC